VAPPLAAGGDPADPHAGHDHGPGEGHDEPNLPSGPSDPSTVVARVGSVEILAGEVEDRIQKVVEAQTGGRGVPEAQMASVRAQLTTPIVEDLVAERLLDADAAAAEVTVTDDECREEFRALLAGFLLAERISEAEYEARLAATGGGTVEAFIEERSHDVDFRRQIIHARLLELRFPDESAVAPDAVSARYEAELASTWTQPEMVRASHILFEIPSEEEAAQAARAEAEGVLALARAEGADFAALAKEHSDGPSGPQGGDLGFFPRTGAMVEPFAAAAFALEKDAVSDLVETQFGLHIIRVTDRKEASVIAPEEAAPTIERILKAEKLPELRQRHVDALREGVEIEIL
jgi:peptidyl-prolyl cis-trans isomerase C